MKYNPLPNMKVKDVELINQLGQLLENRLMGRTDPKGHKYLAIDFDGIVWVYSDKPTAGGFYWRLKKYTSCKCLYITLPRRIKAKINMDNFKYLLFKLGKKEN